MHWAMVNYGQLWVLAKSTPVLQLFYRIAWVLCTNANNAVTSGVTRGGGPPWGGDTRKKRIKNRRVTPSVAAPGVTHPVTPLAVTMLNSCYNVNINININ